MKRLLFGLTIVSLALSSFAMADDLDKKYAQRDDHQYRLVPVTGSHIKKKVRQRNIILEGTDAPVIVIDQREIERNGSGQISDVLRHYPGIQINGR